MPKPSCYPVLVPPYHKTASPGQCPCRQDLVASWVSTEAEAVPEDAESQHNSHVGEGAHNAQEHHEPWLP